jgi:hypothetical protein
VIALSIRRPWPWAILHLPAELAKGVENRTWPTRYRGKFLIHAAKGCTREEYEDGHAAIRGVVYALADALDDTAINHFVDDRFQVPVLSDMPSGAIVGWAELTDCVQRSDSCWFGGPYGFVLGRRGVLEPIPCRGMQGFFKVPEEVAAEVRRQAGRSTSLEES